MVTGAIADLHACRDLLPRPADVVDAGEHRQYGAVGDLAREPQALLVDETHVDRQLFLRLVRELHPVEGEDVAGDGHLLAGKQPPQARDAFAQRRERRARAQAHLIEPERHAEADPGPDAAGVEARHRRELHREKRRVPGDGRHDADADRQLARRAQRGCHARHGAGEETVLREPELAEPETLG